MSMWIRRLIPLVMAALIFPGVIVLQGQMIEAEKQRPLEYRDLLYLPSGEYTHFATIGYRHFAADFLFLRAIQAFGASYARPQNLGQLWSYFDTITSLDPRFVAAYSFGNLVVGEEAGNTEKGLELLDKGIKNNPDTYRLAFEAAFFSLWIMNDPEKASGYVDLALLAPDCPSYISRWKGFLSSQMGRYRAAYENYLSDYIHYYNAGDQFLMDAQRKRLADSISQWHMAVLRDKAIEYHEEHGTYPTVSQLEADGAFRDTEWPNWDELTGYLDAVAASGEPMGESDEEIQRLAKAFMRTNWERMARDPTSNIPVYNGYLIIPGEEATWPDGSTNESFCGRELKIALIYRSVIKGINSRIRDWQTENRVPGEPDPCPTDLSVIDVELDQLIDPWGGKVTLNQETCTLETSLAKKYAEAVKYARAAEAIEAESRK